MDRLTEVGIVVADYRDRITPEDQAVAVESRPRPGCCEKDEPVATAYADLAAVTSEGITT
ncbi:hypothetical protein AB9H24_02900 [Micrococcus luteus]|uniref:hypothetical protein n=1 Tax=Micrococcus luteus TaxID=1270 RepID=UPI00351342F4